MPEVTNPVFGLLLNPNLCLELIIHGITADTAFKWRVINNSFEIDTDYFDKDDYYNCVKRGFEEHMPPRIPAFSVDDMELLLPSYYMEKENGQYQLVCSWFDKIKFGNKRLPDLFGEVILRALKEKKIDPAHATEFLSTK